MRLALMYFIALLMIPCISFAQEANICDSVLAPTVFNVGETRNAEIYAGKFRDEMCNTEWSSQNDAENRAKSFNIDYGDMTRSLGIGASDSSGKQSLKEIYNAFCQKSVQDIAYSSTFFNKYRSSDFAVAQWSKCIDLTSQGHFALVVPDEGLTGATIRLTRRSSGQVPALKINSIQTSGSYDIRCYYNSVLATDAVFPEGLREVAITCLKRADIAANFIINTNWGTYDPVYIPGYSKSISALQTDIADSRATTTRLINALTESLNITKGQSLTQCRICFNEVEGSSQCQGNRSSCSEWASVKQPDPSSTADFRDDTDNRDGGCTYRWRIQCQ